MEREGGVEPCHPGVGNQAHYDPNMPTQEQAGDRIGQYRLESVVGHGGCGTVWRAVRLEPFHQVVALKLIRPGMGSEAVLARFAHERQALARMEHPNIARVLDGGVTPSARPYFAMEFIDGAPITDHCDRMRLPLRERAMLLAQACDAVQHAHQRGIIHRDLKPSNILVAIGDDGTPIVKVIDFGVAKALTPGGDGAAMTEAGELIGTPDYMSPEQADPDGADIDTRTDVWGLGAVMHELLCGLPPYRRIDTGGSEASEHPDRSTVGANGRAATLRAARTGDVPHIASRADGVTDATAAARGSTRDTVAQAIWGELGWIPMRAMRPGRDDRYQSAAELAHDLRSWASGGPLIAGPDSVTYRIRAYARTHRTQVIAVAAVTATLVASTAISAWFAVLAGRARDDAERRALETQRIAELQADVVADIDPAFVGAAIVQDALDRHRDIMVQTESDRERRRSLMRTMYEEMIKLNKPDLGVAVIDRWLLTPTEKAVDERMKDLPLAAASVRHGIAHQRWALGQLERAEAIARDVESVRRDQLGPDAPDTLSTVHLLGLVAWSRKDYAQATERLYGAFEGRARALGPDHPDTLDSLAQYGMALCADRRPNEAIVPLGTVLAAQRTLHGTESAQAYGAMRDLGHALAEAGQFEQAIQLLRDAWEGRARTNGLDAPGTARAQAFLGICLADAGRTDEARQVLSDALARNVRAFGEQAPFTQYVRERLSSLR